MDSRKESRARNEGKYRKVEAQWAPRDPRRDSRGERSPWLPLETRPESLGEPRPLLIATGEAIPLRGLEGVPGLPGAPQDEAGLTRKFET